MKHQRVNTHQATISANFIIFAFDIDCVVQVVVVVVVSIAAIVIGSPSTGGFHMNRTVDVIGVSQIEGIINTFQSLQQQEQNVNN